MEAVADGEAIDWGSESASLPGFEGTIRNLRGLEDVRRAFSSPAETGNPNRSDVLAAAAGGAAQEKVPETWGHLQVVELIGRGTFADVYLAYDTKLEMNVALKLLRRDRIASERERFLREARRLAHVRHPNVVSVHGVGEHDGRPGMWMEFLRGKTLEERFEEQGRLAWRETVAIGTEICGALAAIHDAGLVHGDVKTTNIVQDEGRNVLMDFGAAGEDTPADVSHSCTRGTPLVMAPEVFLGRMGPTRAADVYSLGVMLYRLVSCSYPVEAKTTEELSDLHTRRRSIPLQDRRADLPLPFVRVVERAIAHDPAARFSTAGRMGKALLGTLEPPAHPVPRWRAEVRRCSDWVGAHRKPIGMLVTVGLVGVATVTVVDPFPLETRTGLFLIVDGVPTPLDAGARIAPGDQLAMQFEATRDAYVYVFSEGERQLGKLYGLFPLSYGDLHNPLRRGQKHLLPGLLDGRPIVWSPDETGGTERILVIASREPLPSIQRRVEEAASDAEGDAGDGGASPGETLRGIHPRPPAESSKLDEIVRELGAPNKKLRWQVIEVESKPGTDSP